MINYSKFIALEDMYIILKQNIQFLAISSLTSADAEVISDYLTTLIWKEIQSVALICFEGSGSHLFNILHSK